jgi:hypothetical protein
MSDEFKYEYFSSIMQKKIEWLWYPYIPYGKLTLLQGDPGEGKSTFILNVAALLTRGLPMPDGFPVPLPQTVIYQCAEDNVADTVKPRLIAANADCEKIAYIIDDSGRLTLEDDRIEDAIIHTRARLFIIDPLQAFLSQDSDMQSAGRMRGVLGRLSLIASEHNCAIVLIGHMNKGIGGNSLYRSLGSIDIAAIARSVLMIKRDSSDAHTRYMVPIKSSLAPEGGAIAFTLGGINGFQWVGPSGMDPSEIDELHARKNGKSSDVTACLLEMLDNRDMLSTDVLSEMAQLGVSRRTVFSVKKDIGVEAYRKDNAWYWRLPPPHTSEIKHISHVSMIQRNGGDDDEG